MSLCDVNVYRSLLLMAKKKERRWKWIGHVLRKETNDITIISLRWTPDGKRRRGRPKETCRRTVEGELRDLGMTWGEAERKAQDRQLLRTMVMVSCGNMLEEDYMKNEKTGNIKHKTQNKNEQIIYDMLK